MNLPDTAEAPRGSQSTGAWAGPWYVRLFLGKEYVQHKTPIEGLPLCFLEY